MYLKDQSDIGLVSVRIVLKNSPEVRAMLGGYVGGAKKQSKTNAHLWPLALKCILTVYLYGFKVKRSVPLLF